MRVLSFEGTYEAMGEAFGESCRQEIAMLYEARLANAQEQAQSYGGRTVSEAEVLEVSASCLKLRAEFDQDGYEELLGIGRGAGLSLEKVWAMNALTDLRDVLAFGDPGLLGRPLEEGCSSFVLGPKHVSRGAGMLGQTWDLATDNMPYVLMVRRKPVHAPATLSLTTVGCLSLIGMNEAGIAIGTTNIRTRDARLGVGYLDIIHKVLATTSLESAQTVISDAPRAGAHYYYLMDGRGQFACMECTAETAEVIATEGPWMVHCNHVMSESLQDLEVNVSSSSSRCRQSRLESLLKGHEGRLDETRLGGFLADHDGAGNALCRHDFGGISSNGSVIMSPGERKMWVVHGQACSGQWLELSVDEGTRGA